MNNPSKRLAGFTAIEIAVIAAIFGVIVAIALPNFIRARNSSAANACVNNLRQIDGAKQQWALEQNLTNRSVAPAASDLQPYLGRGADGILPYCPVDTNRTFKSSYIINNMTAPPQCRFTNVMPNHVLLSD